LNSGFSGWICRSVIGSLLPGLLLATLLDQGLRGESIFRSIFLFPMAISYIVTGVVWRWLMNPALGDRVSGFNPIFQAFIFSGRYFVRGLMAGALKG
jgi:ABC-type sugar transport system permease subunit